MTKLTEHVDGNEGKRWAKLIFQIDIANCKIGYTVEQCLIMINHKVESIFTNSRHTSRKDRLSIMAN